MNYRTMVNTNKKGQVVIPKKIREELDITPDVALNVTVRGKGVYLQPVTAVITAAERESSYLNLVKKTQGTWDDKDWKQTRVKRKKVEREASKRRKQTW